MTVFNVAGASTGVNFGAFDIDNWDTAVVVSQTGTLWSITPSGQPTWNFTGTFTGYDGNGFPTGGSITSISVNTGSGTLNFNLSSTPVDVAAVLSAISANDEAALFGALFAGNDVITGTSFADVLNGYAGHDNIRGGLGSDTLTGSDGDDVIAGGTNTNTNYGSGDGADSISGEAGNDVLRGGDGDDTLIGGIDNDNLTGRDGDDALNGGNGDDRMNGGLGADAFNGGAGTDIADYRTATAGVSLNLGTGVHTGEGTGDTFTSVERWLMSNFDDSFFGTAANEQVDGYDGADVLNGGGGIDSLRGLNGADTLNGDDGNDTLQGGANDDVINGGNGFDKLYGDAGNDTLTGGADSTDQFIWSGNTNLGSDHITDFQDGLDKIRLVGTGATQFSDLVIGTNGSGWATITLANGTVITLDGVLATSVDASDFLWI